MKKTNGLKRFIAFMTAIMMVLGCISINVFAATTTATWTPTNSNDILSVRSANAGRTYKAYQIFCGDESSSTLSNIVWGMSVKEPANLIKALKSDTLADGRTNPIKDKFKTIDENSTASEVAAMVETIKDKSDDADTFAYIVITALKAQTTAYETKDAGAGSAVSNDANSVYEYSFGPLHDGYYLVEDTTAKVNDGEMISRVMVKVQGPTIIVTKEKGAPTIDKEILKYNEDTGKKDEVKFDDVAIGDTVTFELKSKVPDMSGYNKFFFIMNDQLSKGLTFDKANCNMKVTIDGVETEDYYVTVSDKTKDGETPFKIVFTNFIQNKDKVDKEIIVTYDATVNEDILVGATKGNFNEVNLTYSNNPNVTYKGTNANDPDNPPADPDNPGPGDEPNDKEKADGSVSTTTDSIVYVYTTALNIIKVNNITYERLAGAKFSITGEKLNKVVRETYTYAPKEYEIESDASQTVSETEGLYYKNATGGYVKNIAKDSKIKEAVKYSVGEDGNYKADPAGGYYKNLTTGDYDVKMNGTDSYQQGVMIYTQTVTKSVETVTTDVALTGITGDDGQLYIAGLAAGEYLIKEIEAPAGYNMLDHDIAVKVECDVNKSTYEPTWTFSVDEKGGTSYTTEGIETTKDGTGELEIENAKGSTLPSTGGMGTTVFYVLGSILMAGAAILLISKRRMNAWNK
jgi:fimbrial isopeptide formation D2 family protein/LPXTG-motif cell wall-anchored protein